MGGEEPKMASLSRFITSTTRSFVIVVQTIVSGYAVLAQITLPMEWWASYAGGLAWWWYDRSKLRTKEGQG